MSKSIIGESRTIRELLDLVGRVAPTKSNVLVIGESGTGKELVARMLHELGPLHGRPFIPVNCGAIPETLIESEMFGHRRGSFTGAVNEKEGLFQAANGGTLFLDEVGELPLSMQVKLLRAIQERIIRKVGGTDDVRVDVRIIAATNRDLEAAVSKGTFREDLYYRLNVILIKTPSLRERREDIKLLAKHFLDKCSSRFNKTFNGFDEDAMTALEGGDWPGNVRELENIIERAVAFENGDIISLSSLPATLRDGMEQCRLGVPAVVNEIKLRSPDFSNGPVDLDAVIRDVERIYITDALTYAKGDNKKAASLLKITLKNMQGRLNKFVVGAKNGVCIRKET
ncbi:MAG: sigma-54 dependent transcriptional regulator [Bdellovibrionota bacterium]|mgnify:CR=1 FL=1